MSLLNTPASVRLFVDEMDTQFRAAASKKGLKEVFENERKRLVTAFPFLFFLKIFGNPQMII